MVKYRPKEPHCIITIILKEYIQNNINTETGF